MAKQTFSVGQVLTAAQMTDLQQTALGGGAATAKTTSYTLVAADAGATVIMNNAGATTITVNTNLFAAGDTVYIQNIGAGNCTITAGTATVNTAGSLVLAQYEGGILYFTATGAAIFLDYVQASTTSSSGLTLLNTTTFSATSSQSITTIFNSTYDNYFVTVDYDSSTALDLRMRLRTSSDDTGTGTYQTHALLYGSDGGNLNYADNATAGFSRWTLDTGSYRAHADMLICGPNISGKQTNWTGRFVYRASGGVLFDGFWGGNTTTTTAYTGFTFYPSTGTISGTVRTYGLANS